MFRLQRLEITGFKSFADYTEILFTGSGITAVVGPNGCGKSNVSDCISWVLGEQRAKSLRGGDMKDVIFQGSSKRKPSGMAEVVLHLIRDDSFIEEDGLSDIDEALSELDEHAINFEAPEALEEGAPEGETAFLAPAGEAQGLALAAAPAKITPKRHWRPRKLALDFAHGEAVSITRRLYLSGDSEYLLNGKSCRLRDIQDLFSGTGLSGAHYAIIEQGRIGQILSGKPADRRTLIEEAAGISKFRTRQRAAEARLESAKANLRRISDIVSEIEKQVNSLRRQASKTKRYKILREEFRLLLRQLFAAEGKYLSALAEILRAQLEEAGGAEKKLIAEVFAKEEAFREATQMARKAEEDLSDIRSRHAENALQRDRNEREIIYQEEQIGNFKARLAVLAGEAAGVQQRIDLVLAEAKRLEAEEASQRAETEREEAEYRKFEERYQQKLAKIREAESELEAERAILLQHTAAGERFGEIERQLEHALEKLAERSEGLMREGERAEQSHTEHLENLEKIDGKIALAKENLAGLQRDKQAAQETQHAAKFTLQAGEKALNEIRQEHSKAKNRLETLQELEEKRTIYAPAVQKLFAAESSLGIKFLGTLADRIKVESKAEKAIESLFGNYLQAILVESRAEAERALSYIKENGLGRIAVLAIGGNPRAKSKGSLPMAENLGIDLKFAEALAEAFPLEMSASVIAGLSDAGNEGVFVSHEGEISIEGKLFVAGEANSNEKNHSLLAFKRELRELGSKLALLEKGISSSEKKVEKERERLAVHETALVEIQSQIMFAERDLFSQEVHSKSLRQELERAERHRKVVRSESEQIQSELAALTGRREKALLDAKSAESARIASSDALTDISRRMMAAREEAESENSVLGEKRAVFAASAERRRATASALRRLENELKELESRLGGHKLESSAADNKVAELGLSIAELKKKIESAGSELTAEQKELNKASENLVKARENADLASDQLAGLNHASGEARNKRAEIEVQQAEAATRLGNLRDNCSQELNIHLAGLIDEEEIEEGFDLEASRNSVEGIRRQLDNFGAVNMLALEELAESEERLIFLTTQQQDIIDSINSAEEALREIKHRSRERFRHAFEAINEYFSEFFVELFGGGRGEMNLLEAEDILESGIEIVAQPPGKRLQNIMLLSGGEKAMTAIALVMAIFKYRPSPFCLLDEVDAPLDDANVGRFVDKIEQMSEQTQFIVITHNKRTMEAARALYGVTMEEAGVSKIVSVRFD